jgi:predicted RNA-binding protein with PIN domain
MDRDCLLTAQARIERMADTMAETVQDAIVVAVDVEQRPARIKELEAGRKALLEAVAHFQNALNEE